MQSTDPCRSSRAWPILVLTLILAAGAWFRFHALAAPSPWIDEGFSMVHARAILDHRYPLLPAGDVSWSYAPAHYLMALGMWPAADPVFGARAGSAVAGTVAIALLFGLSRRLTRSTIAALVAAALWAFLLYQVAWSRQARMYPHLQLFELAAFWALAAFRDSRRPRALAAGTLFLLLAVLTHPAGYWLFVTIGVATLLEYPRRHDWRTWAHHHWRLLAGLVCSSLAVLALAALLPNNSAVSQVSAGMQGHPAGDYLHAYLLFLYGQFRSVLVWAALGAAWGAIRQPRWTVPLLAGFGAYLALLSFRTDLFHFRYMLPILFIPPLFAGFAVAEALRFLCHRRGTVAAIGIALTLALFAGSVAHGRFQWKPEAVHDLGPTEPQSPWAEAYRWLASHAPADVVTISTFPMFHDLYRGSTNGEKWFLPFSPSGNPADLAATSRYAAARNIESLTQLRIIEGVIVLDRFGLAMLQNAEIRDWLLQVPPVHVEPGTRNNHVFIWRLPE